MLANDITNYNYCYTTNVQLKPLLVSVYNRQTVAESKEDRFYNQTSKI